MLHHRATGAIPKYRNGSNPSAQGFKCTALRIGQIKEAISASRMRPENMEKVSDSDASGVFLDLFRENILGRTNSKTAMITRTNIS